MMSLAQLRSYVRTHLDVTVEDIPDVLLDEWAKVSFVKIVTSRRRFPANESVFAVSLTAGTQSCPNPAQRITNVFIDGVELKRSHLRDLMAHSGASGTPTRYAIYGPNVYVHPTPSVDARLDIMGARKPVYTWLTNQSEAIDLPDLYEPPLVAWMLCEAFKHQQDIQQANNFAADFSILMNAINGNSIDVPDSWQANSKDGLSW